MGYYDDETGPKVYKSKCTKCNALYRGFVKDCPICEAKVVTLPEYLHDEKVEKIRDIIIITVSWILLIAFIYFLIAKSS